MVSSMLARSLFLVALVPYGLWLVFAYRYHFLDGANLLFHESGHLFFGILGQQLAILGGTLGQFVFPIAAGIHFLREGRPFEAWICVLWGGENLMYTALYMGDAVEQVLPRVGGEIHDWHWMFSRWGVLAHCRGIGSFVHGLGSLVVLGSLVGAARTLLSERAEAADPQAAALHPSASHR